MCGETPLLQESQTAHGTTETYPDPSEQEDNFEQYDTDTIHEEFVDLDHQGEVI